MSKILYFIGVIMVYEERNIWASLIVSVIGMIVYVVIVLVQAAGGPLTDVDWVPIMLWTIGASIVAAIAVSIVWGMIAGARDPDGVGRSDQRDRDIARMSMRVGQAFLVIAGLGVIVLCAFQADWFWIANCMFLGFAASSIIGGIASVIAYRRGLA
jgi:MFS family permease